jgi:hypothetical protein
MKLNKLFLSLLVGSLIILSACKKDPKVNYPIEPLIVLKNINITKDSDTLGNKYDAIKLTLDYTDGDSNLGGFSLDTSCNDFTATFYKKTNGVFNLIESDNPIHYHIPEMPKRSHSGYITPVMTLRTITPYEGELQIKIKYYFSPYTVGDTLKAFIQVIDNDYHKSNISEMEKVYGYE